MERQLSVHEFKFKMLQIQQSDRGLSKVAKIYIARVCVWERKLQREKEQGKKKKKKEDLERGNDEPIPTHEYREETLWWNGSHKRLFRIIFF